MGILDKPEYNVPLHDVHLFEVGPAKLPLPATNSDDWRNSESPSTTISSNARNLALLAAYMANKGEFKGKRIMSEQNWAYMHGGNKVEFDHALAAYTDMTRAGFAYMSEDNFKPEQKGIFWKATIKDQVGCYGWGGFGGSWLLWNPTHKIGFSYMPVDLQVLDMPNERGSRMQELAL